MYIAIPISSEVKNFVALGQGLGPLTNSILVMYMHVAKARNSFSFLCAAKWIIQKFHTCQHCILLDWLCRKVQIFLENPKKLKKLPILFWRYKVILKKGISFSNIVAFSQYLNFMWISILKVVWSYIGNKPNLSHYLKSFPNNVYLTEFRNSWKTTNF